MPSDKTHGPVFTFVVITGALLLMGAMAGLSMLVGARFMAWASDKDCYYAEYHGVASNGSQISRLVEIECPE